MKRPIWPLALCLTLCACSGPAKEPGLTVEEAREILTQALLEQNPDFISYDPETVMSLSYYVGN